jgi:hypothetical protein
LRSPALDIDQSLVASSAADEYLRESEHRRMIIVPVDQIWAPNLDKPVLLSSEGGSLFSKSKKETKINSVP